ncbi:MAG: cbb3-type cytochrome c oxidase subunit I [Actinomycetota bacterium]
MTITENEPVTAEAPSMAPEVYDRLPQNILADGISSGDHKVIGRMWILASMLFGLFTLVADVLVRIERVNTDSVDLFSNRFAFEQWFTLQRVSVVFLFVVPMLIGIAMTMVPLQIGAPSVAFPRAAAAALWTWMVSGVIMIVSWAIDGGLIDRGEDVVNAPTQLSMVAMAGVVIALIVAAVVLITTIFTERSEGMSLYNVPLFTWSMLCAAGIWLLSWPVLVANLIVMWVDARGDAFHSFGGENVYEQIGWAVDQPQVFAYAVPVLGLLGEVIPVSLGRRLKMYDVAMVAIGAFAAFTFGAYAQSYFDTNEASATSNWLYVLGSITLVLPVLIFLGAAAMTGRAAGKAPKFSAQLGLGVMALLALLTGGLVAAIRVADSLLSPVLRTINWVIDLVGDIFGDEFQLDAAGNIRRDRQGNPIEADNSADWLGDFDRWIRDTFDEVAGTSLSGAMVQLATMAGLLAAVAALYYWAPKIFGRRLPTSIGLLAGVSILGGAILSAVPDAITGFMDQPDFVAAAEQEDGVEILNLISMLGSIGVFAGFGLVFLAIAAGFLFPDDDEDIDEDDPWGGHTLEWLTSSPPMAGNFHGPYVVTSEAPLLDDDFVNPYAEAK